jgi:hypothetical protein
VWVTSETKNRAENPEKEQGFVAALLCGREQRVQGGDTSVTVVTKPLQLPEVEFWKVVTSKRRNVGKL